MSAVLDTHTAIWYFHRPPEFWSLLDMIRYGVRDLHALLLWINHWIGFTIGQEKYRFGDQLLLTNKEQETVKNRLECVKKHCQSLEAVETVTACNTLMNGLSKSMTLGECRGQLTVIRENVTEILQNRVFMYIPLRVSKYAKNYENPLIMMSQSQTPIKQFPAVATENPLSKKPFGEIVFNAFPDARFDAEQLALCMVAGASTAAVFHMMRVVEHGVRVLGRHLGLRRMKETLNPKPGGESNIPQG